MKRSLLMFQTNSKSVRYSQVFFAVAFLSLLFCSAAAFAQKQKKAGKQAQEYIEIRVYHTADADQLATIEQYLQSSFLP
ncbi:MAG TPA: hypothetical protein VFT06_03175, partial [Flavisolibacter sp.]|nr:hypothetical protein [Flavisolibacter sp.]